MGSLGQAFETALRNAGLEQLLERLTAMAAAGAVIDPADRRAAIISGKGWMLVGLGIGDQDHAALLAAVDSMQTSQFSAVDALSVASRSRCLADTPTHPWIEAVETRWPAPVAHEYRHLRELLAEGQIIGALWQFKDAAEMLVKFPAVAMLRDIQRHADRSTPAAHDAVVAADAELRRLLLAKPPALGDWIMIADRAARFVLERSSGLLVPELASLFRKSTGRHDGQASPFARWLSKIAAQGRVPSCRSWLPCSTRPRRTCWPS
ncbi:hypothetical protein [Azospirillum sp. B21]|uniref:hypothetical protein n=1 Tax=Azospirillum sp. B21 TaxID=2607496 RepID=UPI00165EF9B8|nr:hypothetical protein [Azospirillum sp. B21]